MISRMKRVDPVRAIMVMILIVMGFSAISLGLTNLNSYDTRVVIERVNETASNTNQLAEGIAKVFFSQNRTNLIVAEVRQVADNLTEFVLTAEKGRLEAEEDRQQLSNTLVPALQRSFVQTDNMEKEIDSMEKGIQNLIKRLDQGVNRQDELVQKLDTIINLLNKTS